MKVNRFESVKEKRCVRSIIYSNSNNILKKCIILYVVDSF